MEQRAKFLTEKGKGDVPPLYYMYPAGNHNFDTPQARSKATEAGLPIERLMPDVHVGAGGAVAAAAKLFAEAGPSFPMSAINVRTTLSLCGPVETSHRIVGLLLPFRRLALALQCETNAGTHDLLRALNEAADLITWFNADTTTTDRLYARTASFCTGGSAQFDTWDQGISFFLANMTWLQPREESHLILLLLALTCF